jgi:hypothetical protein
LAGVGGGLRYAKIALQSHWSEAAKTARNTEIKPNNLTALLALSPRELEHCDIARLNLLCAEGLRGTEYVITSGKAGGLR